MALLRYFKASGDTAKLPDPRGPLSTKVSSSAIESAGHGIVGGAGVNVHPRKLDREIFADRPSAKIGSLENFRLYGSTIDCSSVHGITIKLQILNYNNNIIIIIMDMLII